MKKVIFILLASTVFYGCTKDDFAPVAKVDESLTINTAVGIKLQSAFVTSEVNMNLKSPAAGTYTVKILDISNKVVSKSAANLNVGDNVVTLYTSALPSSAYRIGLYDSNNDLVGITDFNKK
jgi:PBP1b-binding outer membrane lipoprotein LpoB